MKDLKLSVTPGKFGNVNRRYGDTHPLIQVAHMYGDNKYSQLVNRENITGQSYFNSDGRLDGHYDIRITPRDPIQGRMWLAYAFNDVEIDLQKQDNKISLSYVVRGSKGLTIRSLKHTRDEEIVMSWTKNCIRDKAAHAAIGARMPAFSQDFGNKLIHSIETCLGHKSRSSADKIREIVGLL